MRDQNSSDENPSDQLAYKTIGIAIVAIGHGLYLAYKYVRHDRVNSISLGLIIFLIVVTLFLTGLVIMMRRSEARKRNENWFVSRDNRS
jgi:hypothetical protein